MPDVATGSNTTFLTINAKKVPQKKKLPNMKIVLLSVLSVPLTRHPLFMILGAN